MEAACFAWQGYDLWISRSGYTGEDGFEISIPEAGVVQFADALVADERVRPIGLGARDSLRLEAGLPLYGHDLDTTTSPVEANLSFALSKARRVTGGYMGHDRIARELAQGASRRRVGLSIDGRLPAREGAPIFAGDREVGAVTSGGFSPSLQRPIAMGYVEAAYLAEGTALDIEVRGKRLVATVTRMPFTPHHYHRREL